MVEVTFTVSPRLRRIAAHDPDRLPPLEYFRQIYRGSGIDLPEEDFAERVDDFVLEVLELPAGERAIISLHLPEGVVIVRSEEHTSELQSLMRTSYAVFCLKKKKLRSK